MFSRIYIVSRQDVPNSVRLGTFLCGLAAGLIVSILILMLNGVPFRDIVNEFVVFVFFDSSGQAQLLTEFIPLAMVGLAAAAAMKLNFWNIGIEGQMWVGAAAATLVATLDIGPESTRLPLMLVAAALAGTLWVAGPAFLKLRYGINEIVTTLLLTYVASLLVQSLLFGVWRDPDSGFPASPILNDGVERLVQLGWGTLHSGLWLTLAIGAIMWWLMSISRFGFFVDHVGQNPVAAKAAGLPIVLTTIGAVILSGGVAGIAGATIVAGQEYRLTVHIADGYTFSAIVVAFLARFNSLGCLVAALALAGISSAGEVLKAFYQLPLSMVTMIQAILLLSVLIAEFFGRYHIALRKREAA